MGNGWVSKLFAAATKTTSVAPRYRPATLVKLDQRTKEARLVRETRAALVAHVGGAPSAVQSAIIDQLVQLRLRLAVMDRRFAETGGQTEHGSRVYLAWANSFSRLLRHLGIDGAKAAPPSLASLFTRDSENAA